MATGIVFAIVMAALAVILLGYLLLERRRAGKGEAFHENAGSVAFRDCYDLCATETGKSSTAFTTMCTTSGRV